jgi:uncharacterized lipoprotein YmbA
LRWIRTTTSRWIRTTTSRWIRTTTSSWIRVAAPAAALALTGCSFLQPAVDPSRFFVLNAIAPAAGSGSQLALGVGPLNLPSYLAVSEIQVRESATELMRSPVDRWAEPLQDGILRVLAQDLSAVLGTRDVVLFPWYAEQQPDVQVAVSIRRFEIDPEGAALLEARYEVTRPAGGGPGTLRDFAVRKAPSDPGTAASVAALSEALADLAADVAAQVTQVGGVR